MKASIHCPIHGLQPSNPNTEHAVACDKCFPRKIILHLCADTGSDTKPYKDAGYEVILVGSDIGVENYHPPKDVYGIIANPVCLEFSTARKGGKPRNPEDGMKLVKQCLRIIDECDESLKFYVIENPARGVLKNFLGTPQFTYQPYQYGSPWSKHTALWGKFNKPPILYKKWQDVPDEIKIPELYVRPTATYANGQTRKSTGVPSLAFMHARKHLKYIKEFEPFIHIAHREGNARSNGADMDFRSLCSQKFAQAFYEANK